MHKMGWEVSKQDVADAVKTMLDKEGKVVPQFKNNRPGKYWWYLFLSRNQELAFLRNTKKGKQSSEEVDQVIKQGDINREVENNVEQGVKDNVEEGRNSYFKQKTKSDMEPGTVDHIEHETGADIDEVTNGEIQEWTSIGMEVEKGLQDDIGQEIEYDNQQEMNDGIEQRKKSYIDQRVAVIQQVTEGHGQRSGIDIEGGKQNHLEQRSKEGENNETGPEISQENMDEDVNDEGDILGDGTKNTLNARVFRKEAIDLISIKQVTRDKRLLGKSSEKEVRPEMLRLSFRDYLSKVNGKEIDSRPQKIKKKKYSYTAFDMRRAVAVVKKTRSPSERHVKNMECLNPH